MYEVSYRGGTANSNASATDGGNFEGKSLSAGTLISDMTAEVFHFNSPREWYVCDAAVLSCFEHRFERGFRKFLSHIGIVNPDHVKVAGGVKNLAISWTLTAFGR
ncbi:MAG: hypothetical protein ABSC33_05760 [Candidatus Sulfotelmatobacter sp.]